MSNNGGFSMTNKDLIPYETISDEEEDKRIRRSVSVAKKVAQAKGQPTCEFDKEKKAVYFQYPDGHRYYPAPNPKDTY